MSAAISIIVISLIDIAVMSGLAGVVLSAIRGAQKQQLVAQEVSSHVELDWWLLAIASVVQSVLFVLWLAPLLVDKPDAPSVSEWWLLGCIAIMPALAVGATARSFSFLHAFFATVMASVLASVGFVAVAIARAPANAPHDYGHGIGLAALGVCGLGVLFSPLAGLIGVAATGFEAGNNCAA
jgi:hypothetical protein